MIFASNTTNKVPITQEFIENGIDKKSPVLSSVLNSALGYISQNATSTNVWDSKRAYKKNEVVTLYSYDTRTEPNNPRFNVRHYLCVGNNKGICPAGAGAKISQEAVNEGFGEIFYDEYTIGITDSHWVSIWG